MFHYCPLGSIIVGWGYTQIKFVYCVNLSSILPFLILNCEKEGGLFNLIGWWRSCIALKNAFLVVGCLLENFSFCYYCTWMD